MNNTPFVTTHIKWIMLVSGVLTATMLAAAIAPESTFRSNFGETLSGPAAILVVRNWGILIALVGAMLIYGAYNPPVRRLVVFVAAASKLSFIVLVLSAGTTYLQFQAGIAAVVDLLAVVLFSIFLLSPSGSRHHFVNDD